MPCPPPPFHGDLASIRTSGGNLHTPRQWIPSFTRLGTTRNSSPSRTRGCLPRRRTRPVLGVLWNAEQPDSCVVRAAPGVGHSQAEDWPGWHITDPHNTTREDRFWAALQGRGGLPEALLRRYPGTFGTNQAELAADAPRGRVCCPENSSVGRRPRCAYDGECRQGVGGGGRFLLWPWTTSPPAPRPGDLKRAYNVAAARESLATEHGPPKGGPVPWNPGLPPHLLPCGPSGRAAGPA